ncbi:MAG: type II toxin-antitoxin system VapC family toxin [Acidimicrobiia bacterium]
MNDDLTYLDSSALVKLVIAEPESGALHGFLAARPERASSALAKTELIRAVAPHGRAGVERARAALLDLFLIEVDEDVLEEAAELKPMSMRSLDAVHLASALSLGGALHIVVTYDEPMVGAAEAAGLSVESPS